jgi:GTP1/Obg family GTP-binding protein
MRLIAKRLGRYDTGVFVQEIQADVLRRLKELEQVFGAEIKRRNKQPAQGGGGNQKPPLIPPAAEILMLRTMQEDINGQLKRFIDMNPRIDELDPMQREFIERLGHRQGVVKDIWLKFMEAMGVR